MLKSAIATIALLALANPALAAGCATPDESVALKTAVMQQELMVAAFQCHEADAYNRFVTTYRGELQASDAVLKTFFVRRGGEHGEAGYDSFKTKAANLSALEQARHSAAFCADAHGLFDAAFANRGNLMSFVESRSGDSNIGNICTESRPVLAKTDVRPVPAAKTETVKVAEVAPNAAIGGVPTHSLPAIPYRRADAAPRAQQNIARDDDADDAGPSYTNDDEAPPPRPRYYQIRQPAYSYAPRSYGPPPGWQDGRQDWRDYPAPPPPRYGWYSPY
jgi:hypothetical protein